MTDIELLATCEHAGIRLELEGVQLHVRAPKGALTEPLRSQLAAPL